MWAPEEDTCEPTTLYYDMALEATKKAVEAYNSTTIDRTVETVMHTDDRGYRRILVADAIYNDVILIVVGYETSNIYGKLPIWTPSYSNTDILEGIRKSALTTIYLSDIANKLE